MSEEVKKQKYYTQVEVAEMLNLTTTTINSYIKELTDKEKKGKFNVYNRPNEDGIELLKQMWRDKNPNQKRGREEIDELNQKLEEKEQEIKDLKEEKNKKIERLEEEKEELYKKILEFTDKFSQIADQQQKLQALQMQSDNQKLELEALKMKIDNKNSKKKPFFKRLFSSKE